MSSAKLDEMISLIIESSAKFSDLVDLVGLDPYTDFQDQDLSGIDFGSSDLHEFRFSGSILDNSDLSRCTLSRHTLTGVKSAKGAVIPRIVDEVDYGRSISVRITPHEQMILTDHFGSVRRAILETISTASAINWPELEKHLHTMLAEGRGGYEIGERKVGVKLPMEAHHILSRMSHQLIGPKTAIMRLLVKITVSAVEDQASLDLDLSFAAFIREFKDTLGRVRSDSPRQGFLL